MERTEAYFKRQIKGLILVLGNSGENQIARSYVIEKLNMILRDGIGFHPLITEELDD